MRAAAPRRSGARLFTFIAVVGSLHGLLMLGLEANRFAYSAGAVAALEADLAALEAERDSLRAVVAHRHDPLFREQLARQQGFVYLSEVRVLTRPPLAAATERALETP